MIVNGLASGSIRNEDSLVEMRQFLHILKIPLKPCPRVIHVAGTKGKGTTCACLEALFRSSGMKTGLFTSPHLISPTERIRINGRSVCEDVFASTFFQIKDKLGKESNELGYFRMLTLIAWKIFHEANLDIAIVEVGIGGRYDSTNVLVDPDACVITALALDHIDILGNNIASIAWHKAGIIKPRTKVFTVQQSSKAMDVICQEVNLSQADIKVVTSNPELDFLNHPKSLNASLAIDVFRELRKCDLSFGTILSKVKWYGRQQQIDLESDSWFLDGAHTLESISTAVYWYTRLSMRRGKVLAFHCSADRDYKALLSPLLAIQWSKAYFVVPKSSDSSALNGHQEMAIWFQTVTKYESTAACSMSNLTIPINSDILVTGSLHLVGDALDYLDQDLTQI